MKVRARSALVSVGVHLALLIAIWMFDIVVYATVLTPSFQIGWLVVDLAVLAGCALIVYRFRVHVGFGSLGDNKLRKLVAVVIGGTAIVFLAQWLIPHSYRLTIDENSYAAAMRYGGIDREGGLMPYNMRWLVPMLAGRWNVLPVDDLEAIKAINFASLAVTSVFMSLLLVRLRIPLRLAATAPLFLMSSYLGVYADNNRLVIDPLNYAMYTLLFHALLRREHWKWFGAIMLVSAFNSEKVIAWAPILTVTALVRGPWSLRNFGSALWVTVTYCAPAVLYVIGISYYLRGSQLAFETCFENLHFLSFSSLGAENPNVKVATSAFRSMWFPFGAFTMFSLLGFVRVERAAKPVVLLLLPILLQSFISCDARRIIAYTFIVYLPLGYHYLATVYADVPRWIAASLFTALAVLVVAQSYLLPALAHLGVKLAGLVQPLKLGMSAFEIVVVIVVFFVHQTFFAAPRSGSIS